MGLIGWARPGRQQLLEPMPGAAEVTGQPADAQLVNRLGARGVPAPAVIDALRPTGQADIRGGQRIEVGVTITPTEGQPYQTTIMQSFLPSQLEGLSPGKTIGVTYDPDNPAVAVISAW